MCWLRHPPIIIIFNKPNLIVSLSTNILWQVFFYTNRIYRHHRTYSSNAYIYIYIYIYIHRWITPSRTLIMCGWKEANATWLVIFSTDHHHHHHHPFRHHRSEKNPCHHRRWSRHHYHQIRPLDYD
jgi:hypothetical protein